MFSGSKKKAVLQKKKETAIHLGEIRRLQRVEKQEKRTIRLEKKKQNQEARNKKLEEKANRQKAILQERRRNRVVPLRQIKDKKNDSCYVYY